MAAVIRKTPGTINRPSMPSFVSKRPLENVSIPVGPTAAKTAFVAKVERVLSQIKGTQSTSYNQADYLTTVSRAFPVTQYTKRQIKPVLNLGTAIRKGREAAIIKPGYTRIYKK